MALGLCVIRSCSQIAPRLAVAYLYVSHSKLMMRSIERCKCVSKKL